MNTLASIVAGGSSSLMRGLLSGEKAYEVQSSKSSQGWMDTRPAIAFLLAVCTFITPQPQRCQPWTSKLKPSIHERFSLPMVTLRWYLYYGSFNLCHFLYLASFSTQSQLLDTRKTYGTKAVCSVWDPGLNFLSFLFEYWPLPKY